MIRALIHTALMALVLAVGMLHSSPTQANGIEQKLNDSFDAMVNNTPASVYMGNRRGVISGGSLSIRTPVVNIRPFALRGPSISVGCGGIDAFFGSFSFISKEQLVQAMRAIVTAAITYAFQLALEAMCPTCADILAKIQGWLNDANELLTNSCEATRNMMDKYQISASISRTAKSWRCSSGAADDCAAAENKGSTTSAEQDAVIESGKKVFQELPAKGNQVWNILQKTGESSFGFAANDFFEEMMSMTGTIIACIPDDAACAAVGKMDGGQHVGQKGELQIWRKPDLMTLSALVEGSGSSSVKQYSCKAPVAECEGVEVISNPLQGMAQRIRLAFLGAPGTNSGIIWKARYDFNNAPTPEEEKWMKLGGSITGMALRLTARDPDMARGFIEDNAEAMAAEIIITYLDKYMLSTKVSLGRSSQDGLKEAFDLIQAASARAHNDAKKYYEQSQAKAQFYQTYLTRMDPRLTN